MGNCVKWARSKIECYCRECFPVIEILIILRNTVFTSRDAAEVQAEFIRQACAKAGHEVHYAFDLDTSVEVKDDDTTYHRLPNHSRLKSWRNFRALMGSIFGNPLAS